MNNKVKDWFFYCAALFSWGAMIIWLLKYSELPTVVQLAGLFAVMVITSMLYPPVNFD